VITTPAVKWSGTFDYLDAGPVVRDIDGDGEAEAVFMDDTYVRVLRASDGTVKRTYAHGQIIAGYGTQAVLDVDQDGQIEVLCGYDPLLCLTPELTPIWDWTPTGFICNSPIAAFDIDGDGILEVLVGGAGARDTYCLTPDGIEKWINTLHGGYSALAIADIDNDGEIEILGGCNGNYLYCLRPDGTLKWELATTGDPRTAALYDIDGDGKLEIFVSDDSYCYCVDEDGTLLWQKVADSVYGCPCVVEDLDGDGVVEAVFIRDLRSGIVCYRADDGTLLWDLDLGVGYIHGPVACDIDGDGTTEIIFGADDDYVYCVNPTDGTIKWRCYTNAGALMYKNAPCLTDVDNDEKLEILVGNTMIHCIDSA